MRDTTNTNDEAEWVLSTEQALAAIEEHRKTLGRIAAIKARWDGHTTAMLRLGPGEILTEAEALALRDEHRKETELSATQQARWHLHMAATFGLSEIRPALMSDPNIVAYYQEQRHQHATGNPESVRKASEKKAWVQLRDKVSAANTELKKEEAAARKPVKQSKPINDTRSEAMSKEEGVKPVAGTPAQPTAQAGDGAADAPFFDWGDPLPNAADLAADGSSMADASEWADARTDRRKQGVGAQADLQANDTGADTLTEEQQLAEVKMLKRITDTAEGMASAPAGAVPSDETMISVVAEDLKALAAIRTRELRERALWVMAESRRAQPAYDAEIFLRTMPELREEMAMAVKARAAGLAASEAIDQTVKAGTPTVENTIVPVPTATQQATAASTEDKTNLNIPLSTVNLPDLVDAAAAVYQAQRALEVAERAALRSVGVENTIDPAPTVVLDGGKVQEIDAAALEAVAAARAKDRQAVAKSFGWNTIEKGETAERKPTAQVPVQPASAAPVVAVPTAPEPISTVVPDEVERAYLHVGNRFYMPKNPQRVAFEDHGDKLKSALSDMPVTIAMVQIAQARGWTSIKLNGTPEFCKEAWRQASLRGLAVDGYKPTELDLADLARRMPKKAHENQVAATGIPTAAATATAAPVPAAQGGVYISAEDAVLLAMAKAKRTAQAAPVGPAPAPATLPVPGAPAAPTSSGTPVLPGDKLVAHGPAKYQHNPDNPESYFAVLENAQGKQRTVWGVKLDEAIAKAGVNVGDQITLYKNGEEQVTVDANVKDNAGKVVGTQKIGATRNEWAIKAHAFTTLPPAQAVQQHPDLAGAFGAATKLGLQAKADGFSPAALAIIAARQQENIGKAIARGELPKAELREKVEAKRSPQQEMAQ